MDIKKMARLSSNGFIGGGGGASSGAVDIGSAEKRGVEV